MSKSTEPSHYQLLQVPADVPAPLLRQAYRRAAQRNHPDRRRGDPQAQEAMARINEAYAVLSNPQRREAYDDWLRAREARSRADLAWVAARPTRFEASWPWGLVAATMAIAMASVGTVLYKEAVPSVAVAAKQPPVIRP
ncbi:MAG: hypothetical protein AVDCRST_MAG51-2831 [uncultured Ramlibacter sp.]|uniref:J domain-containing protein n=1 Tax=uncultured Ramlibacter sp. TaxID=260755 RepID=A0A6J4QCB1_9BURK|nr:MAG: hypothetical protein AVDCRST_MAG51-2831 [uncultured Ramlibacter sp.]